MTMKTFAKTQKLLKRSGNVHTSTVKSIQNVFERYQEYPRQPLLATEFTIHILDCTNNNQRLKQGGQNSTGGKTLRSGFCFPDKKAAKQIKD